MGIKYLTRLLKEHSPDSIKHEQLHKLSGKACRNRHLFINLSMFNEY